MKSTKGLCSFSDIYDFKKLFYAEEIDVMSAMFKAAKDMRGQRILKLVEAG